MGTSKRMLGLACATLALCLLAPAGCKQTEEQKAEKEQEKLAKDQAKQAKAETKQQTLQQEADAAMSELRQADQSIDGVIQRAAGYALFPSITKGGFIVGGAHGRGIVYEKGRPVAEAELSQASVGFLAGGQAFRELIVFESPEALQKFRSGQFSLGADVNAVAMKSGVGGTAQFKNGVAIFVKPVGGAMFDASVAGQKFSIKPMM